MPSELAYKVARYRVLALIGHTLLLVQVQIKNIYRWRADCMISHLEKKFL